MPGLIASPPSYITAADFLLQNFPPDVAATLAAMNTANTLQDLLNRASGAADALMKKSLLAREVTEYYEGSGTQYMALDRAPLIYVKELTFAQPGLTNIVPLRTTLVDYLRGEITTFMPFLLQGLGEFAVFPAGFQLSCTYAYGYGYPLPQPTFVLTDGQPSEPGTIFPGMPQMAPGEYDIVISAATQWGETAPSAVTTFNTTTGQIAATINPVLGCERYRVFAAPHGQQPILVNEVPAVSFDAKSPLTAVITAITSPAGLYPENAPTVDTSAHVVPPAIIQAVRYLALDELFEEGNPANRGITADGTTRFASTQGGSGQGISALYRRAQDLLAPYKLSTIF